MHTVRHCRHKTRQAHAQHKADRQAGSNKIRQAGRTSGRRPCSLVRYQMSMHTVSRPHALPCVQAYSKKVTFITRSPCKQ